MVLLSLRYVLRGTYLNPVGDTMFFEEKRIRSVSDLLRAVESHRKRAVRTPIWFRGSTNKDYDLVPSLGRLPYKLKNETALINAFKQNAVPFVDQRPQSHWEWLFLARHHGVPTRLLDWTESPLIGLYFNRPAIQERQEGRGPLATSAYGIESACEHLAAR